VGSHGDSPAPRAVAVRSVTVTERVPRCSGEPKIEECCRHRGVPALDQTRAPLADLAHADGRAVAKADTDSGFSAAAARSSLRIGWLGM
jgi:hypothetical protein